jgi:para-nitrobenzyl esterase
MPTLTLPGGRVRGRVERGVEVYRGIPYGSPPVGPLRFRAATPAAPWRETLDARRPARVAPQRAALPRWLRRMSAVPEAGAGEDCLHVNVFTPRADGARRPVMVFVHGGGYTHGSGSFFVYAGHRLARRGDVVVVTFNYRLGVFGALDLRGLGGAGGDQGILPNVGLRDQLAALEWVRDNIECFGGDPECVTLFGQSAGAMSAGVLLCSRASEGLFHRAILQSGAASNVLQPSHAREIAEQLLRSLGLDAGSAALGESLRARSVLDLLDAQEKVSRRHRLPLGMLAWQPVVDGVLVPDDPLAGLASGGAAPRPLLIGTNRDEWKMFTAFDRKRRQLDAATLRRYLERTFDEHPSGPEKVANALLGAYGQGEDGRALSPSDIWAAFQTDRVFRRPALELADAHAAAGGETFVYRFDWAPRLGGRRLGACHSMELPWVFGTLRDGALGPALGLEPGARTLSDRMQSAWLTFAREGDPGPAMSVGWPRYRAERAEAMTLAAEPRCEPAQDARRAAFWADLGREG